jgi:ribosomal protein S18 acetylase RimI-like enzyme
MRPASPGDAAELAVLLDMASRGMISWLWGISARTGQSPFEFGRTRILTRNDLPSHYSHWTVAQVGKEIVGAFSGYLIPDPYDVGDVSGLPEAYEPLLELEALGAGTWFLMSLAVFPEYQRQGYGSAMLQAASLAAHSTGASRMTLTVSTGNTSAFALYMRTGFTELARRRTIPYPGSGNTGDWVLLEKSLPR